MAKSMVPHVEAATGLKLDLGRVKVVTPSRRKVLFLADEDLRYRTGVSLDRYLQGSLGRRELEQDLLGLYLPSFRAVTLVAERLANEDAASVRARLGHELVHAAQHQAWPRYFREIDEAIQRADEAVTQHGRRSEEAEIAQDVVTARLAFVEAHASMSAPSEQPERSGKWIRVVSWRSLREQRRQTEARATLDSVRRARPDLWARLLDEPALADVLLRHRGPVEVPFRNEREAEALLPFRPRGGGRIALVVASKSGAGG